MANTDFPFGLRAITNQAGTAPQMHEYTAATAGTLYEGQPVAINTTGQVVAYSGTPTGGNRYLGVAVHHRGSSDTARTLLVYDDPEQEYEVQVDDNSVTLVGDLIGRNFSLTSISSGSGTTLQSKAEVDGSTGSTVAVTANTVHEVKGLRFSSDPQNDLSAVSWQRIIVKFNPGAHIFAAEDAGV